MNPFLEETGILQNHFLPEKISSENIQYSVAGKTKFLTLEISEVPSQDQINNEQSPTANLVASLFNLNRPMGYLIRGTKDKIRFFFIDKNREENYVGQEVDAQLAESDIETIAGANYPGIRFGHYNNNHVLYDALEKTQHLKLMTGIPLWRLDGLQPDVLTGIYGKDWWILIICKPIDEAYLNFLYNELTNKVRRIGNNQENDLPKRLYLESLLARISQIETGKSCGLWRYCCYFGAESKQVARQLESLLIVLFSSPASQEKIRTVELDLSSKPLVANLCIPTAKSSSDTLDNKCELFYSPRYTTLVTSTELAAMIQFPKNELPGVRIRKYAKFGMNSPEVTNRPIGLGKIIGPGIETRSELTIQLEEMAEHGLLVGVTGTGKSSSLKFHILNSLYQKYGIPFLVIESGKKEYRQLRELIPDLRVFTVGNKNVAPFSISPFVVEEGTVFDRHIGLLNNVLRISLPLYGPLPYLLEMSIYNIYANKGIDPESKASLGTIFPTVTELYHDFERSVGSVGYVSDSRDNIAAALKGRLGSLKTGLRGRIFDQSCTLSIAELLEKPTVIELSMISDDSDKALIIGILMATIYVHFENLGPSDMLRHITVIEEAHRIFSETKSEVNPDIGNAKAVGVSSLSNMLTEARAFGEGVFLVDQSPSKLAKDAINNTNLKMVFRLSSSADREAMAEALGLTDEQRTFLGTLDRGEAIVFMRSLKAPVLVRFDKTENTKNISDEQVRDWMCDFYKRASDNNTRKSLLDKKKNQRREGSIE